MFWHKLCKGDCHVTIAQRYTPQRLRVSARLCVPGSLRSGGKSRPCPALPCPARRGAGACSQQGLLRKGDPRWGQEGSRRSPKPGNHLDLLRCLLPDIYSGAQERRNNYSSVPASLTRPFSDSGRMGYFFPWLFFLSSEYQHWIDSSSQLTYFLHPRSGGSCVRGPGLPPSATQGHPAWPRRHRGSDRCEGSSGPEERRTP